MAIFRHNSSGASYFRHSDNQRRPIFLLRPALRLPAIPGFDPNVCINVDIFVLTVAYPRD
jgi:hypothetical protein